MTRIILASQSPSRRAILRGAGVEPVIVPAHVDEEAIQAETAGARATVEALAVAKSEAVATDYPNDIVIGCDSMLLLEGKLQGKPHTVERTVQRWREQAGKTASLLTGHCIIFGEKRVVDTVETQIFFARASESDIARYAASGQPLECAGAFTLEALGGWFIDSIDGDPASVIGLSLALVRRALYEFGFNASDFWS